MKKTYSKPALFAESFELAEHIAACNGVIPGAATHWNAAGGCGYQPGGPGTGTVIFNKDIAGSTCTLTWTDNIVPGATCYNSAEGPVTAFGS